MVHLMFSAKRNYRFVISGMLKGASGGLLSTARSTTVICLGPCLLPVSSKLEIMSLETLWGPVPVSDFNHGKFIFPNIESEFCMFQFMLILSCPFAIYLLEEIGSMFSLPSH